MFGDKGKGKLIKIQRQGEGKVIKIQRRGEGKVDKDSETRGRES